MADETIASTLPNVFPKMKGRGTKPIEDLTSYVFGRLTVRRLGPDVIGKSGRIRIRWECICECGETVLVWSDCLRSGRTKSCGCLRVDTNKAMAGDLSPRFKHGYATTPEYHSWHGAINRTTNPKTHNYSRYGGRGIRVSDEWMADFTAFLHDMGPCPPGHTLDRIDNNLGYQKGNCRWVTPTQQNRNKHNNVLIEVDGRSMVAAAWSEISCIPARVIHKRINMYGWSPKEAVFEPLRKSWGHKK